MDPGTQELAVGGRYWIHHRIPFRDGVDPTGSRSSTTTGRCYYYNWVFPATYLQHYGQGLRHRLGRRRSAVDRMRFRHICVRPDRARRPRRIAPAQQQLETDPTIHQDVDICHRVQASHESGVAPAGRLLPTSEVLLTHLYKVGLEMLADLTTRFAYASPRHAGLSALS